MNNRIKLLQNKNKHKLTTTFRLKQLDPIMISKDNQILFFCMFHLLKAMFKTSKDAQFIPFAHRYMHSPLWRYQFQTNKLCSLLNMSHKSERPAHQMSPIFVNALAKVANNLILGTKRVFAITFYSINLSISTMMTPLSTTIPLIYAKMKF